MTDTVREHIRLQLSKLSDSDIETINHNLGIICSSISCSDCPLLVSDNCVYCMVHEEITDRRKNKEARTEELSKFSDDALLNELITRYDRARNGGK